jgi:hypothetical protein
LFDFSMLGAFFGLPPSLRRVLNFIPIAGLDLAHNLFKFCLLLRRPVCHLVLPLLERFTKALGGLETEGQATAALL